MTCAASGCSNEFTRSLEIDITVQLETGEGTLLLDDHSRFYLCPTHYEEAVS